MWKSVKDKFESNSVHSDCTTALVHLMSNNEPHLFYHREIPKNSRLDIHCHGDILIGVKIPRVETRYWGFSSEPNLLNLIIDNESIALKTDSDVFTYLINGTHPLVFIGHNITAELVTDTAYQHIDFVWCVLSQTNRQKLAESDLIYHTDSYTMVSKRDSTKIIVGVDLSKKRDEILIPSLKMDYF